MRFRRLIAYAAFFMPLTGCVTMPTTTDQMSTPLAKAVYMGDDAQIRALLDAGADPSEKRVFAYGIMGFNAFFAAVYPGIPGHDQGSASSKRPEVLKLLVDTCAKIFVQGSNCADAWEYAARISSTDTMKILLAKGMDVNAPLDATAKITPLMYAGGNPEIVAMLLERGADPNAKDIVGQTPLFYAVGSTESVKLLLKKGADPTLKNNSGEAPLTWARRNGASAVVALLQKAEAGQAEKVRKEAERAALEPKLPLIKAAEEEGDAARAAGKSAEALEKYGAALAEAPRGSEPDRRLRRKVIGYALSLKPRPAVPEEAKRHTLRAQAILETAEGEDGYGLALAELEKASLAAPWWADGYINLGLAQEKAKEYEGAMSNLKLYLAAAPGADDAEKVQKKIYRMEVVKEEADKAKGLSGGWVGPMGKSVKLTTKDGPLLAAWVDMIYEDDNGWASPAGNAYQTTKDGNNLTFRTTDGWVYTLLKQGNSLQGTLTIPSRLGTENTCVIPGETIPITGTLSPDGNSIDLTGTWTNYAWTVHLQVGGTGLLDLSMDQRWSCASVRPIGTNTFTAKLIR